VRKAGDQVRITVQLADATTGEELWAERYDRPLRDIFALQDEIVRRIVTTLNLQLTLAQRGFLIPRKTDNLEAYDDVLRGAEYVSDLQQGWECESAPDVQKSHPAGSQVCRCICVAWGELFRWLDASVESGPQRYGAGFPAGATAIALEDSLSPAHSQLAAIYLQKGQYDQAVTEAERGIALNPNAAFGYWALAEVKNTTGKSAEALVATEKAMRLDPHNLDFYLYQQGWAYTQLGRYEEAIPGLKRDLALTNNLWDHSYLA
jgi:adenylate cyclase